MPKPSVDIVVRAAVAEDAGELLTLQLAAWVAEGRRHGTFDIEPLQQSLDELRDELADSTVLVATLTGGRIVGTIRGRLIEPDIWYLARLGVVPDLQGNGIARVLFREIEQRAPAVATRIALTTGPKSDDNIAYYQRRGYARILPDPAFGPPYLVHMSKDVPKERT